ncbi:MAG: hypothetical protein KJO98_07930 [Rhodothermia bacterium]|nr:hypothetical protein [Rhodothermia bacterium]
MHRSAFIAVVGAMIIVSSVGCASTEKKYKKGVEAEESGRFEEAAELYIQVLRSEPDWPDARARLESTGAIVIENRLARVASLEADGAFVAAADQMATLDSFHARATAVGAQLELPPDFDSRRERMEDLAVRKLLRDGDQARSEARWADALRYYDRALQRGRMNQSEIASVRESRATVLVEWADQSLAAARYRMAFEKAQQGLDIVGHEHSLTRRIHDIQRAALEAGSRFVAMLPVAAKEGVRRDAGTLLLTDLNDILVYDHWSNPPPFILVADPVSVRRELRSEVGRRGRVISRSEAVAVGRIVAADWVLAPEVADFRRTERITDSDVVRTRTKGRNALDTTYVLNEVEIDYHARAIVRIYEVSSGDRLYEGHVDAGVKDRYQRGEYTGDYRHLDLSGSELAYFDPDELRVRVDRIEEALADELARNIAERVYSRTTSWIQ